MLGDGVWFEVVILVHLGSGLGFVQASEVLLPQMQ